VGPARAQAIVAYREQHPFQSIEELSLIRGLTPARLTQLRPYVVP
jgi:competence protein ComEA